MPNLAKTGLTFELRGRYFALVEIEIGPDNSYYFLPLQPEAQVQERIRTSTTDDGHVVLNVAEVVTGQFPMRKVSRHPSGYYHVKDVTGSGGNRSQDGLRGESMADRPYHTFLVIGPQAIESLQETPQAAEHHVKVSLAELVEPFTVHFAWLHRDTSVKLQFAEGELLGSGIVVVDHTSLPNRLCIALLKVGLAPGVEGTIFPARTFYMVR